MTRATCNQPPDGRDWPQPDDIWTIFTPNKVDSDINWRFRSANCWSHYKKSIQRPYFESMKVKFFELPENHRRNCTVNVNFSVSCISFHECDSVSIIAGKLKSWNQPTGTC